MATWEGCSRPECKKEWAELSDGTTQDEQDRRYEIGSYGLQHCETSGCHTIYFRGKNGVECEVCEKEVCEGCQCDDTVMIEVDDDEYVCKGECERTFEESM